jgi:two-component sensor histidine kinase
MVASTLIAVLAVSLVIFTRITSTIDRGLRDEIVERNGIVARSVARETGVFLDSYFHAIAVLASRPDGDLARSIHAAFPAFAGLAIADKRGRLASALGSDARSGFDVSRTDFFRQAGTGDSPYLSDASLSRASYHPTVYLSQRFEGGVVVGELDLQYLSDYIRQLSLPDSGFVGIADAKGTIVAHSVLSRVLRSENIAWTGPFREALASGNSFPAEMAFEGDRYLLSAARVPGRSWIAIVAKPASTIRDSIAKVRDPVLATMIGIVAAVLLVTAATIYYLKRDLLGITAGFHAIASGDFGMRPPEAAFREFRDLAEDFGRMAQAVREREARLTASLAQKDILFKEIHHRVKNNLQLVESLLSLEAQKVEPENREPLKRAMERVYAMAMVHELLYRSDNLAEQLRFDLYLRSIASSLSGAASLEIETEELAMDLDRAIPLGLIANELITNALKYAGIAAPPAIRIGLSIVRHDSEPKDGNLSAKLVIEDNGPGFPPGFDPKTCDSLGLRLVLSLVCQIGGKWELAHGPGARWTILFSASQVIRPGCPGP